MVVMKYIEQCFLMKESYFVEVSQFVFETVSPESSDAGNVPEFHNILNTLVNSFDSNVITISDFFNLCCQATVT